jgi:hypothetical protein
MTGKIRSLFSSVLSQDMEKQARQVEAITIFVFIILLLIVLVLWQFKIDITVPKDGEREVVGRMNVFELLLRKK